jgi:hypothetical protein
MLAWSVAVYLAATAPALGDPMERQHTKAATGVFQRRAQEMAFLRHNL